MNIGAYALFFFVVLTSSIRNYLVLVVHLVQRNWRFHYWQKAAGWISTFSEFCACSNLISGASLLVLGNVYVFFANAAF